MTVVVTEAHRPEAQALIRALRARGDTVRAVVPDDTAVPADPGIQVCVADPRDPHAAARALHRARAAVILPRPPPAIPRDTHDHSVRPIWNLLASALMLRVPRVVLVSAHDALLDGRPVHDADERRPLPETPWDDTTRALGDAERQLLRAVSHGLHATVVRPALLWSDDPTVALPRAAQATATALGAWIDGGAYPLSTTHLDNLALGTLAALDHGPAGGTWFITDGPPVAFRPWLTPLLRQRRLTVPARERSYRAAWALAATLEEGPGLLRRLLPTHISRRDLLTWGRPFTVRDDLARREIAYQPTLPPAPTSAHEIP